MLSAPQCWWSGKPIGRESWAPAAGERAGTRRICGLEILFLCARLLTFGFINTKPVLRLGKEAQARTTHGRQVFWRKKSLVCRFAVKRDPKD